MKASLPSTNGIRFVVKIKRVLTESEQLLTAAPTCFQVCKGLVILHAYRNLARGIRREYERVSGYKVSPT